MSAPGRPQARIPQRAARRVVQCAPASGVPALLQVRGLGFAYPGQPALFDDWSADVPAGLTRVQGERGKTSLLRLLAGELHGSGRITLAGARLDTDPAAWRRAVFWLDPRDAAWDALRPDALMALQADRHPGLDAAAWQHHLAGFDLLPHRDKAMCQLSSGSRRKVALAAALAAGCALTLLDEPTAGLHRPALAWLAQALADAAGTPGRAWLLASAWGLEDALPLAATIDL